MTLARAAVPLIAILGIAATTGSRRAFRRQEVTSHSASDSASLVARAVAIVKADGQFGSLQVTTFKRVGDVTTITFQPTDPDALGGGVVIHINERNGQVCLEVFG